MTTKVQDLIQEVEELSTPEQVELMKGISPFMQDVCQVQPIPQVFWEQRSLDQIIKDQNPPVIKDIKDLKSEFWPEEESVEDFISYVSQQRYEEG